MTASTVTNHGYTHTQTTASTTWTIPHMLNCSPVVYVYILYGGVVQRVLPAKVEAIDSNHITITFSQALTGYVSLQ